MDHEEQPANSGAAELPADFDEETYLQLNPDLWPVVEAGILWSGAEHWVRYGRNEGRMYKRAAPPCADFDEGGYLQLNPDVAPALRAGVFQSAYQHWIECGRDEGRLGGRPSRQLPAKDLAARPAGVNYFGFHSQPTGLGSAARAYVQALKTQDIPLALTNMPPWHLLVGPPAEWEAPAVDAPYRVNCIHQNPDMLPFFRKTYGRDVMEQAYNIGLWVWELPNVHPFVYRISRLLDEIWAPSVFCRNAYQATSAAPVVHMPCPVAAVEEGAGNGRQHFGIPAAPFVFLYMFDVGSFMERKNPLALVRAFRNAFGDSADALLVLKYSDADANRRGVEVLEARAAAPNIRLISGILDAAEMASLYRLADCFVSPHRSEGFGLNIAQSMALGKPVIATGYSGNMDFTTPENSYLIEFNLAALDRDIGPYLKNGTWAEPSISHLSALLRRVFTERAEAAEKGRRAAQTMRSGFSPESVGAAIRKRLEERGLLPAEAPQRRRPMFRWR